jgi:hypothetical protein
VDLSLHLNLRRKFFTAAASIPSCCRCESAIEGRVAYFESHQVFTPLHLESAMVRFETGRLDGRTVNEIKFQNDTRLRLDFQRRLG